MNDELIDRVINLELKIAKLIELLYATEKNLDAELKRHRGKKIILDQRHA